MVMQDSILCIFWQEKSYQKIWRKRGIGNAIRGNFSLSWICLRNGGRNVTTGFLGVTIMATILPLLVMTAMQPAFTPYMLTMITTVGYEPIHVLAMVISNINQGVACAVVALKTKSKNLRLTGISCAITAII